jgi:hypothetical protein
MKQLLALALFALTFSAYSQTLPPSAPDDSWTTTDTIREAAIAALFAVDAHQTRQIVTTPGLYETNPLIGKQINRYFALTYSGQLAISPLLPREWRSGLQNGLIVMEVSVTAHNRVLGLKWEF